MKELGGKTGVLVGLDLPSAVGELKQGSDPYTGATVWVRGGTFKAESETADLWQPKWNETQTVLAAAIHSPDRDAGPLEGTAAGSCSLGIVEQPQGKGCCWLRRDGLRGCEGGDCGGKCLWRKARQPWKQGKILLSHARGWSHHHSLSFPTGQHWRLSNREAGPSNAWCTELQSRTPFRLPF